MRFFFWRLCDSVYEALSSPMLYTRSICETLSSLVLYFRLVIAQVISSNWLLNAGDGSEQAVKGDWKVQPD
ncbi:hypothetical protein Tcan_01975 [Toxocara canis]|uniref:Uncharacterized protein n=1 Tax=Toxocara canis TaxID=6265 RepID=A0A0B2UNT0_TOXCA|nr:hypothetical protein Tcan_01975 [Toxocara canis]